MGVGYSWFQSRGSLRFSPGPGKAQARPGLPAPYMDGQFQAPAICRPGRMRVSLGGPAEEMAAQSGNPGRRAEGGELPGSPASAAGRLLGTFL